MPWTKPAATPSPSKSRQANLGRLLHALRVYDVRGLREQHFTLEQHFKNVYLKGEN